MQMLRGVNHLELHCCSGLAALHSTQLHMFLHLRKQVMMMMMMMETRFVVGKNEPEGGRKRKGKGKARQRDRRVICGSGKYLVLTRNRLSLCLLGKGSF